MIRIAACFIAAKVVHVVTLGNRPDEGLPYESVDEPTLFPEMSVAVPVDRPFPSPTIADFDLVSEIRASCMRSARKHVCDLGHAQVQCRHPSRPCSHADTAMFASPLKTEAPAHPAASAREGQ